MNERIMQVEEDNFNFWFPAEIEKAAGEENKPIDRDKMFLKGIASTDSTDLDGETMVSDGLDVSYLLSIGFINWHHQSRSEPNAIIGEPVAANRTKNGLFIKAKLYNTSVACDAYDLAIMLQEQSKTRRLGWSVEGKVMARDPNNEKRITKAKLTGVALTHSPKNSNTFAEITKAMIDGSTTDKILGNNDGSTKYRFETKNSIITFSKDGDLHFLEKSNYEDSEKALSAGGMGSVLSRESLEGGLKLIKPNLESVMEQVFNKYPTISFNKALLVSNKVLNNIDKKNN